MERLDEKGAHDRDFAIDRIIVSYNEKPGIQAKGNTSDDLLPVPDKHPTLMGDHEYVRYGTVSLHSGKVIAHVSKSHKGTDFIEFLKKLQNEYLSNVKIRLILDKHSAHVSKETRKYLETQPNRFEFVFTPGHGFWLNLIEVFFSKMTRSFLKGSLLSPVTCPLSTLDFFVPGWTFYC